MLSRLRKEHKHSGSAAAATVVLAVYVANLCLPVDGQITANVAMALLTVTVFAFNQLSDGPHPFTVPTGKSSDEAS